MNKINLQLETKRLVLRPMLESDFDSLLRIFTDTEVMAAFDHPLFTHEQMDISSS